MSDDRTPDAIAADLQTLQRGIWRDQHGHLSWSIPELLELAGLAPTPENEAYVIDQVRRLVMAQWDTPTP